MPCSRLDALPRVGRLARACPPVGPSREVHAAAKGGSRGGRPANGTTPPAVAPSCCCRRAARGGSADPAEEITLLGVWSAAHDAGGVQCVQHDGAAVWRSSRSMAAAGDGATIVARLTVGAAHAGNACLQQLRVMGLLAGAAARAQRLRRVLTAARAARLGEAFGCWSASRRRSKQLAVAQHLRRPAGRQAARRLRQGFPHHAPHARLARAFQITLASCRRKAFCALPAEMASRWRSPSLRVTSAVPSRAGASCTPGCAAPLVCRRALLARRSMRAAAARHRAVAQWRGDAARGCSPHHCRWLLLWRRRGTSRRAAACGDGDGPGTRRHAPARATARWAVPSRALEMHEIAALAGHSWGRWRLAGAHRDDLTPVLHRAGGAPRHVRVAMVTWARTCRQRRMCTTTTRLGRPDRRRSVAALARHPLRRRGGHEGSAAAAPRCWAIWRLARGARGSVVEGARISTHARCGDKSWRRASIVTRRSRRGRDDPRLWSGGDACGGGVLTTSAQSLEANSSRMVRRRAPPPPHGLRIWKSLAIASSRRPHARRSRSWPRVTCEQAWRAWMHAVAVAPALFVTAVRASDRPAPLLPTAAAQRRWRGRALA